VDDHTYEGPTIEDYGDLLSMTQAGELQGMEDAGVKFSILDVSNGQFP
jgi:hypothetical protein